MANTDFAYFKDDQTHVAVLFSLAMATHFSCPWLWNTYLYPNATLLMPDSRLAYSVAALVACVAGLVVVGSGRCLPKYSTWVLAGVLFTPLATALTAAGITGLFPGEVLYLGIGLFGLGRFVVFLLIGSLLCRIGRRSVVSITAAGLLLSVLPPLFAFALPESASLAMAACLESASALLCLLLKRGMADDLGGFPVVREAGGEGPVQRAVEEDVKIPARRALLPTNVIGTRISLNFLLAIGMFFLVFGFSGRYFDQEGSNQLFLLGSFAPLAILGLWMLLRPDNFSIDLVYRVALILTALGFVCIAFPDLVSGPLANAIVMGGSHCFVVIYWAGLCSACNDGKSCDVSVLLWGRLFKSGGTLVGTFVAMGMLVIGQANPEAMGLAAAVIALLYMVTALVVLRSVDYLGPTFRDEPSAGALEAISARYGLTPRESEIMQYLVKGRSAQYIQDTLVLSRNTVKSHMKHIYTKLGVHTQQELISLFERCEKNKGSGK